MCSAARDLTLEHFRWSHGHANVRTVFRDAKTPNSTVAGPPGPLRALQAADDLPSWDAK